MKRIVNHPSIQVFDEFFTEDQLDVLNNTHNDMTFGWKSNRKLDEDHSHWNKLIVGPRSSKNEGEDLQQDPAFLSSGLLDIWNDIKIVAGDRKLMRAYFNGYTYGTEGYFHTDSVRNIEPNHHYQTILIYCNDEWDINWAGETVFINDDYNIIYASLPLPNRFIIFNGAIQHAARSVSRACPVMRKILTFKTIRRTINEKECGKFIYELTKDIKHSKSTFFSHLYNTYKILHEMGMPTDVKIAGMFHSVYGTEYFKQSMPVDRDTIREMIGEYAEDLVYTFCTMTNRTKTILSQPDEFSSYKNVHLAAIEYANLKEQLPRTKGKRSEQSLKQLETILEDFV